MAGWVKMVPRIHDRQILQISWSPNHNRQFSEVPNYLRQELKCNKAKRKYCLSVFKRTLIFFSLSSVADFRGRANPPPPFVFGRPRVDFMARTQLILTDTFDFSPSFLRVMETLHDLCSSYVPKGPALVQLPQVAIEYTFRQLYVYIVGSPVEIQTPTHRELTGRSMTAPPPCCRPTIFFRRLNLIAFLSWQGRIRLSLQK
jgi:hypothetical protein